MHRWLPLLAFALTACVTEMTDDPHEAFDFEVDDGGGKADGISAVFDRNNVIADELFVAAGAMGAAEIQAFLEDTPYGTRSWLASATIEDVPVSEVIAEVAQAEQIHPLVLLARMQVETSLVSKTATPSQHLRDRALGCGCPDGGGCSGSFRGLGPQLSCGAQTMRRWFDASIDGSGEWRVAHSKRTLDDRVVTPETHATASLYAYTPWVLVGRGGTWLAWNVTRKYVRYAEQEGLARPPAEPGDPVEPE